MSASGAVRHTDLLALLPCPLKTPLERSFGERSDFHAIPDAVFELEGNANHDPSWSLIAGGWESLAEFPEILVFPGFNFLHGKKFRERFIASGGFAKIPLPVPLESLVSDNGLRDPEGHYAMLCVNPLVIAYNAEKLGSRKKPAGFADLARAEMASSVLMRGKADQWCETTLLGMESIGGKDGVRSLARSVLGAAHPAEMVKRLCDPGDAAVACILPYFFAKHAERKNEIVLVWPDEGAIASPVTMLVKEESVERLEPVWRFFLSDEAASICSGAFFPACAGNPRALASTAKDPLPTAFGKGRLVWPGWSRIYGCDIVAEMESLQIVFREALTLP